MKIEVTIPDAAARGQHGVYAFLNGDGEPLYIGRTSDLYQRARFHRSAAWWTRVRAVEWTPCDDAVTARVLERQMIAFYQPAGNSADRSEIPTTGRMTLPPEAVAALHDLKVAAAQAGYRDTRAHLRFRAYVKALRAAGWTFQSIGTDLGVSREYVRQVAAADAPEFNDLPPVPAVPPKPQPEPRLTKWEALPHLAPETAEWMRTLHADARRVNGVTPADSPLRVATIRLTELIAEEVTRGVTVAEVARTLGVTHYAVRSRLARHGYDTPCPSAASPVYLGRPRSWGAPVSHCKAGHPMSGDNLRVTVPGGLRVCRACEKRRQSEYRQRQAAS